VLELGAGTGKLTRVLVEHFVDVFTVEPDPAMRRSLIRLCPESTAVAAAAEAIPLASASVDGVFSAEAFHWFAHERALAEITRVLRPRGALVLMWNRPAGPVDPPIAAVEALVDSYWPENVAMPLDLDPERMPYARDWAVAFEHSVFEPLQVSRFENVCALDRDGLVAFFGSMGWISELADDERLPLLREVRALLTADEYRLPFETHVHSARLAERN
jgi:SAM-dependent methyltransferase